MANMSSDIKKPYFSIKFIKKCYCHLPCKFASRLFSQFKVVIYDDALKERKCLLKAIYQTGFSLKCRTLSRLKINPTSTYQLSFHHILSTGICGVKTCRKFRGQCIRVSGLVRGEAPQSSGPVLKPRFFEDFGGGLFKESIIGWEPVSINNYTRPGSSIKQPTKN